MSLDEEFGDMNLSYDLSFDSLFDLEVSVSLWISLIVISEISYA